MKTPADRCAHCGYDLEGLRSPRCPECGKIVTYRRARSLLAAFVSAIVINLVFVPIATIGTLICIYFGLEHKHWDPSMTLIALSLPAALTGTAASFLGCRDADELANRSDRRTRRLVLNLAFLPIWYAILFAVSVLLMPVLFP